MIKQTLSYQTIITRGAIFQHLSNENEYEILKNGLTSEIIYFT